MKKIALALALSAATIVLTGCNTAAKTASSNISKAAENFEIYRSIVFTSAMTGQDLYATEGFCSTKKDTVESEIEVTCKTGPDQFYRHTMGTSPLVTYVVVQLDAANVSEYHHRIITRPQSLIPDFDLQYSGQEVMQAITPDASDSTGTAVRKTGVYGQ